MCPMFIGNQLILIFYKNVKVLFEDLIINDCIYRVVFDENNKSIEAKLKKPTCKLKLLSSMLSNC